MQDLSELNFAEEADSGSDLVLLHPIDRVPLMADDDKPITIRLIGSDSDVYLSTSNKQRDQNIEEMKRKGKYSSAAEDYKGGKLLAKCTLSWHGVVQGWVDGTKDNTPAEMTYENAVKLYNNRGVRWIREQVDEFIVDRANFTKAS